MTGVTPDRGCGPTSQVRLPAGLTLAGRQAFDRAVRDYVAQLSTQLVQQAHRHHRPTSVYTNRDVCDAKDACARRLAQDDDEAADLRGYAIILLLAAAGFALLATHTSGIAQAGLLGLFVAAETAGLLLVRRSRRAAGDE